MQFLVRNMFFDDTIIIIPARLGSTRLPNKPLADIQGKSMIVRVMEQGKKAHCARVIVAAGNQEIYDEVIKNGGEAVMTETDLPSGTDRVYAAYQQLSDKEEYRYVVNLQGDQPTIDPELIRNIAELMHKHPNMEIGTLVAVKDNIEEYNNPNVVKSIISFNGDGKTGRSLYYTRAAAPWGDGPFYHHVGMYAFRVDALEKFVSLPPSELEKREKLEQLRALEAGMYLGASLVNTVPLSVDTPEDLEKANNFVLKNTILA